MGGVLQGAEVATVNVRERALLAEDFARLKGRGSDLPERALRYVLQAEGPDVLDALSATKDTLDGLRLGTYFCFSEESPRRELFGTLESRDAGLLLRLAKVYEAASRQPPYAWARSHVGPGGWLVPFLIEARQYTVHSWPAHSRACPALDCALVEEMLCADQKAPDTLVRAAFFLELGRGMTSEALFAEVSGFGDACVRHLPVVAEALDEPAVDRRVHALKLIDRYAMETAGFLVSRVVKLAVGGSKKAREAAGVVLGKVGAAALPGLEEAAKSPRASEREQAYIEISRVAGPDTGQALQAALDAERDARLRRTLADLLAAQASPQAAAMPTVRPEPPAADVPLRDDVLIALRTCVDAINQLHETSRRQGSRAHWAPISVEAITDAWLALQAMVPVGKDGGPALLRTFAHNRDVREVVARFLEHPSLRVSHAVHALILFGVLSPGSEYEQTYGFLSSADWLLSRYRSSHKPPLTLSDLAAGFQAVGLDDRVIGRSVLRGVRLLHEPKRLDWGADAVWPYFADRLELLETAFTPSFDYGRRQEKANAFRVVQMFPEPPRKLQGTLWRLAFGGSRNDRSQAQACLERAVDRTSRTMEALGARKAETRAVAAEWLGRQGDVAALDPLRRALSGESNEGARAAMLSAIEALGGSVDQYLGVDVLEREARSGLAAQARSRSALEGFPFEELPRVRWAETGVAVSAEVLQWFLVQSHHLGSPEPGPLLRRQTARFKKDDRSAYGLFVLEQWIHADLEGGSAIADRGVLAVAAACCDRAAVPLVGRYIREQYGTRLNQCKALLQMLCWIDDPAAVQLLLSIAERFRTKGIQAEAKRLAGLLAEEKGWSIEDLADRSIPTGGLATDGTLVMDYGPRRFTARISGGGLALFGDDGQPVPSLPAPRKADDRAKAAEARKELKAARGEVETTLRLQKRRLYEALCSQRTWRFSDWDALLNRHPIAGHCCRRLAWAVVREGSLVFRPLEDGSLSDERDRRVTVGESDRIRLAHSSLLEPELCAAWTRHFLDYEVPPLFDQFERLAYRLPESAREETVVTGFEGHVLKAADIRRKSTALGYERGPFEGHMWFQLYRKRFDSLGLEAIIHFTGTRPDEENPVAIRTLSFAPLDPERHSDYPAECVALGEVPPVLLSECWNDLRSIAAEGSGLDPDWKKKLGW